MEEKPAGTDRKLRRRFGQTTLTLSNSEEENQTHIPSVKCIVKDGKPSKVRLYDYPN